MSEPPSFADFNKRIRQGDQQTALPVGELADRIRAEQKRRWEQGERPLAETYLQQYPQLQADPEVVVDIIYHEFLLREQLGEQPDLEEYRRRFPAWANVLQQQVELHRALNKSIREEGVAQEYPQGKREQGCDSQKTLSVPPTPATGNYSAPPSSGQLGAYQLLGELGRGGMGVVYKAFSLSLQRPCALKVILSGIHSGSDEIERFKTEAQAIARLQHPGIVQVFEIGEHDGKPFMALEFCGGGSLAEKLAQNPLPPRAAARVVRLLAEAMQAAHESLVLHRDLKPANVLLTENGEPKITDFGLAKKLDEQGATRTGSVMGTPSYMPPEQANGSKDIGPTADIYALGAILYECLASRPPFRAATPLDTILQVVSQEPVPVTQLNPNVPRDLETICLKCLRKEPGKRYPTAQDLADDLQRWLDGEPITARPAGMVERSIKWVRRRPSLAALVAVSVAALMTILVGGVLFTSRLMREVTRAENAEARAREQAALAMEAQEEAEDLAIDEARARRTAEKEALRAEHARHALQLDLAIRAWEQHDLMRAEQILGQVNPQFADLWETRYARGLIRKKLTRAGGISPFTAVLFRPDGKQFATANEDWSVALWNAQTNQVAMRLAGHKGSVRGIAYTRDGTMLASSAGDRTIKIWDTQTGKEMFSLPETPQVTAAVAFNHDGTRLASGSDDRLVRVWDLQKKTVVQTLTGHKHFVSAVTFNHDGKLLASAGKEGVIKVWDAVSGSEKHSLQAQDIKEWNRYDYNAVNAIAFSPDGKYLAGCGNDQKVRLWSADTFQLVRTIHDHSQPVTCLTFDSSGTLLLSGSEDQSCLVRLVPRGEKVATLRGYSNTISGVAVSPDGRRILTGTKGNMLDIWTLDAGQERAVLRDHPAVTSAVAIAPDGRTFASGDHGGNLLIREAAGGQVKQTLKGHKGQVLALDYSGNGNYLISAGGSAVTVWDLKAGAIVQTLSAGQQSAGPDQVTCAVISRDGSFVVSGSDDTMVRIWDTKTGKVKHTLAGHQGWVRTLALSPDDRLIVSGSLHGAIRVWDAATGTQLQRIDLEQNLFIDALAISRDGKHLATSSGNVIKIWNTETWQEERLLRGHFRLARGLAFLGNGRLASCADDHTVRLWDVEIGEEKLTLRGHIGMVLRLAVSPDDSRIITCGEDRTVRIWETPAAR